MSQFILMLTLNDETVSDAVDRYDEISDTGVSCIGFKDVGIPAAEQARLVDRIRSNGHTAFLEVVDLTADGERQSAQAAVDMGVDYLVGGTRISTTLATLEGSGVRYMPYVGTVTGHPAVLEGDPDQIAASARQAADEGVDGINLLAYRYVGDGLALAQSIVEAVDIPVISAGSIATLEQVRDISAAGTWGFTIGSALIEGNVVPGSFRDQVVAVVDTVAHISRADSAPAP